MLDERIYNGKNTQSLWVEDLGEGYYGVIVTVKGVFPRAYIRVPEPKKFGYCLNEDDELKFDDYRDHMDFLNSILKVHGGVKFAEVRSSFVGVKGLWIAWEYNDDGDYCYFSDYPELSKGHRWTLEEIQEEVKNVINKLKK